MPGVRGTIVCANCGAVVPAHGTRVGPGGVRLCPACHPRSAPEAAAGSVPGEPGEIAVEAPDLSGRTRAPCPRCGEPLVVGVPACAACGYDPRAIPLEPAKAEAILGPLDPDAPDHPRPRGKRTEPAPAPTGTCKACGYSLAGLPPDPRGEIVCPECGRIQRGLLRPPTDEENSRYVARMTYLQPALMLCIGLTVLALLLLAQGWWQGGWVGSLKGPIKAPPERGWKVALGALGGGLAFYAIGTLASFGATVALGLLWTGLNTTLRVLLLQIAGLLAAALALHFLLSAIPLPIPSWLISTLCGMLYAWYLAEMQEIELHEAGGITLASMLLTWGIWTGITLAL
jgi:hypothetical protein